MRNLKMKFRRIELEMSQTDLAKKSRRHQADHRPDRSRGVQSVHKAVYRHLQSTWRHTERFILGGNRK